MEISTIPILCCNENTFKCLGIDFASKDHLAFFEQYGFCLRVIGGTLSMGLNGWIVIVNAAIAVLITDAMAFLE